MRGVMGRKPQLQGNRMTGASVLRGVAASMAVWLFNRDPKVKPERVGNKPTLSGLTGEKRVSPTSDARSPPDTGATAGFAAVAPVSFGSRLNDAPRHPRKTVAVSHK